MTPDILTALPNLSIGVVSILALVYVTREFLKRLKEKDAESLKRDSELLSEIREREIAFRKYAGEVQSKTMSQLQDNTQVLERVIDYLNNHKRV